MIATSDKTLETANPAITLVAESNSVTLPEKSLREWGIALAAGLLSCLYLMCFYRVTVLDPDEGISLEAAERILHGQVPYKDFFSFLAPGSYYWTALLFRLFGDSILTGRAALVIYGGLFSALLYLIARRVCSRGPALLGAALLTVTCLPYSFMVLHNWDSTVWTCLALYCAVRLLERPNSRWAFLVGLLASLTCLFEQSKGAGLILGLGFGFVLVSCTFGRMALFTKRRLSALAAGLALPPLATLLYFGANRGLGPMAADFEWPLKHYNSVNHVPYGFIYLAASELHMLRSGSIVWRVFAHFVLSPSFLVPALPILALILLGCRLVRTRQRRAWDPESAYYVLLCSSMGGLLLSVVVARPGLGHFMFLGPVFYLVLCWVFQGTAFGGTFLPAARRPIAACVLFSFSVFGLALLMNAGSAHHPLETRHGTLRSVDEDAVVSYVEDHAPKGARIFVYPYQPLYYYLTGRENPTSYPILLGGFNTPAQFRQATRQLESDRTPAVLLAPSFPEIAVNDFPGTPLSVLGEPDPMVETIFSHYHACKTLRSAEGFRFVFLMRNGLACPRDSAPKKSAKTG